MSLPQILSQLSGGMVRTVGIFFLTLIFSLPLGLVISFGRMAKNPVLKNLFKNRHFRHERNAADASAYGVLSLAPIICLK